MDVDNFLNEMVEDLTKDKVSTPPPSKKNKVVEELLETEERIVDSKSTLNFIGSFNYVPDSREYEEGTQYRNVNEGVVYINKNNLWEEYVRDGKKGDTPRWSPSGGGLGERDVKKVTGQLGIFNNIEEANSFVANNPNIVKDGSQATINGVINIYKEGKWVDSTIRRYDVPKTPILFENIIGIGGWGVSTGGKANVTIVNDAPMREGIPTIKVDASGSVGDAYITLRCKTNTLTFGWPFDISYWIQCPIAKFDLAAGYSSDTPSTDPPTTEPTNRVGMAGLNAIVEPGSWTRIRFPVNSATSFNGSTVVVTGTPDSNVVKQVKLYVFFSSTTSSQERIAYFDLPSLGQREKSSIIFTYDGDPAKAIKTVLPKFQTYGIAGAAIFNDRNNSINTDLAQQYRFLIDNGWDLGCNGQNHTNYQLNPSILESECLAAEQFYIEAGFDKPVVFGCPVGANSGEVDSILSSLGYVGVRGTGGQNNIYDVSKNIQNLAGVSIEAGVTAATTLQRIDSAIATGSSITLLFHEVVDTVTNASIQISTSIFDNILAGIATRIANNSLVSKTMSDYCKGF